VSDAQPIPLTWKNDSGGWPAVFLPAQIVAGPPAEGDAPKATGVARSLDARPQVPILHRSGQIVQRLRPWLLTHRRPAPTTLLYKAAQH